MELVIGLAITGMMAAAGASTFSSIIDHRKTIKQSSVTTERAGALREMIRSWIYAGTIQIQRGGGPRGLTRATTGAGAAGSQRLNSVAAVSAAQAAGDELTFTTTALNPSLLGNVRIRMYIDADANTPEKGLTIEYQPSAQLPLVRKMLDSTMDSLRVEYLDTRTNRWYPGSEAATIQPRAVRVALHTSDSTTKSPILELPMLFMIGSTSNFSVNFNTPGR
jgi:type II secretory pathway pseudopilin PulG